MAENQIVATDALSAAGRYVAAGDVEVMFNHSAKWPLRFIPTQSVNAPTSPIESWFPLNPDQPHSMRLLAGEVLHFYNEVTDSPVVVVLVDG